MGFHLESTSPDRVNTPTPNKSQREKRRGGKSPVPVYSGTGDFDLM